MALDGNMAPSPSGSEKRKLSDSEAMLSAARPHAPKRQTIGDDDVRIMAILSPEEQRAREAENAKATGRYIELSDDDDSGGSVQRQAPVDAKQAEVKCPPHLHCASYPKCSAGEHAQHSMCRRRLRCSLRCFRRCLRRRSSTRSVRPVVTFSLRRKRCLRRHR